MINAQPDLRCLNRQALIKNLYFYQEHNKFVPAFAARLTFQYLRL